MFFETEVKGCGSGMIINLNEVAFITKEQNNTVFHLKNTPIIKLITEGEDFELVKKLLLKNGGR